jgi:CheY-like chemotaxis protein
MSAASREGHSSSEDMVPSNTFAGLRVLVIEDESMVTMLIEDTLADIGCAVTGTASRLDEAMEKAASLDFDMAILDVNLNGAQTFAVADALASRGKPLIFATGYGAAGIPSKFRHIPLLPKPFQQCDMEIVLRQALKNDCAKPA